MIALVHIVKMIFDFCYENDIQICLCDIRPDWCDFLKVIFDFLNLKVVYENV